MPSKGLLLRHVNEVITAKTPYTLLSTFYPHYGNLNPIYQYCGNLDSVPYASAQYGGRPGIRVR